MVVSSYLLKTVSFWNGVQGNLQTGCLETTVRYSSMFKVYDKLTKLAKNYTPWLTTGSDCLTVIKHDLLLDLSDWYKIWFTTGSVWQI